MTTTTEKAALYIQTPEGVTFTLPLAGPITRFFAFIIDTTIIFAISGAVLTILGLFSILLGNITIGIAIITIFAINTLYGILFEYLWNGQTLGKRALNIRVADIHGLQLNISQIITRNLLRAADMLPSLYLLGGITALLTPYMQRLGDIAANTVVITTHTPQRPAIDHLQPVHYNTLRDTPWLEARLRQNTTPEEATLLLRSLLRRDTLDPTARHTFYTQLTQYFLQKHSLPATLTQDIPPEQVLRNLLDTLYRDTNTA